MSDQLIRSETLEAIFKSVWTKPNTAIKGDALEMAAKYMDLFIKEAIERAKAKRAESSKPGEPIDESDLEKILAQLLLDF